MRTVILLLLGIMVAGGGYYGVRLLWRTLFPAHDAPEILDNRTGQPVRPALHRFLGWLLLAVILVLFALMVLERLQVSGEIPDDLTVPPPIKSRTTASDRQR
ncbi:MAG: hypothetical protein H7838_11635 [Magnetococcus sp. DMHC-8]